MSRGDTSRRKGRPAGVTVDGAALRRRRSALGLTQQQTAELSGLTVRTVQHAERGHPVSQDSACRLSVALGTPYAEILRPTAEQVRSGLMEAGFAPPPSPEPWAGRFQETATLCAALRDAAPVTGCITGVSGIGKSALAQHVVAAVQASFPDGVVWVLAPRDTTRAAVVQAEVAQALGFRERMPSPDLVAPEALYSAFQARVWKHRRLLVIDDVESEEVLAAFVGRVPGWALVTTSRRHVAAEVAGPTVLLGPLDDRAASSLLASHLGASRVEDDPEGTREVATRVGCVPRGLQIAGRVLRDERYTRPGDYALRLARSIEEGDALAVGPWLNQGDPDASFASSHAQLRRRLSPHAWDALGDLSVLDGQPFPLDWASAVLGEGVSRAGRLLGELRDYYLLQEVGDGFQLDAQTQRVATWIAGERAQVALSRLLRHAGRLAEAIGALPADEMLPAFHRHATLWRVCLDCAASEVAAALPAVPPEAPDALPQWAGEGLKEARLLPGMLWGLRAVFRLTAHPVGWRWLAAGSIVARETEDHLGYGRVAELFGWWRVLALNDPRGALQWHRAAEEAYARADRPDDVARMALLVAQWTWGSGMTREARSAWERAVRLCTHPGVGSARRATALAGSAMCLISLKASPEEVIARFDQAAALCEALESRGDRLIGAAASLNAALVRRLVGEPFDEAAAVQAWRAARSLCPQDPLGDFIVDTIGGLLDPDAVTVTTDAHRRRVLLGSSPELATRTMGLLMMVLLSAHQAPPGMADEWAGGLDVGGVPLGAHDLVLCLPLGVEIGHPVPVLNPLEPLRDLLGGDGTLLAQRWLTEVLGTDHPVTVAFRRITG